MANLFENVEIILFIKDDCSKDNKRIHGNRNLSDSNSEAKSIQK